MHQEQKFFICKHCGNIVGLIQNAGVPLVCCGKKMEELEANPVDASTEKHKPLVTVDGGTVTVDVGEVTHPMTDEHNISWVYVQTERGGQRKALESTGALTVKFMVTDDDKPLAVFAYCNLHGLWKTTADEFQKK